LPTPACPDCEKLLEELSRIRNLIWLWDDLIAGWREQRGQVRQERDRLLEQRTRMVKASQEASNLDPSLVLSDAERSAQVQELTLQISDLNIKLSHLEDDIDDAQDRVRPLREERDEWFSNWEYCNRSCGRTKSPWFTRPLFWAPIAAVAGGVAVAGGGDAPTGTTTAPPLTPSANTPVSPPPVAPPATPPAPPPPAPIGRQPAATQNVTNCVCVTDAALLNGVLRFCENTAPLRVSTTAPGVMEVAFPSPLPVLRGPFNTSTGAFELTGISASGQALTFGGTIDPNGGFTNAFLHVDSTSMRRTSYTFATVGR
jgi:hypothetical protein